MYTIIYQSYQFVQVYIIIFVFSPVLFPFSEFFFYVETNQLEQSLCGQTHEDHITVYRTWCCPIFFIAYISRVPRGRIYFKGSQRQTGSTKYRMHLWSAILHKITQQKKCKYALCTFSFDRNESHACTGTILFSESTTLPRIQMEKNNI